MTTISEFLTQDHRDGDALFAAAAQAMARGDWAGCGAEFAAFVAALKRHMGIEEQVLFPAFEEATGMSAGPTRVMRHEHHDMLKLLDRIELAVSARDAAGYRAAAESFSSIMTSHSAKEENVLYPMCDQVLSELDGEKLAAMMRDAMPVPATPA